MWSLNITGAFVFVADFKDAMSDKRQTTIICPGKSFCKSWELFKITAILRRSRSDRLHKEVSRKWSTWHLSRGAAPLKLCSVTINLGNYGNQSCAKLVICDGLCASFFCGFLSSRRQVRLCVFCGFQECWGSDLSDQVDPVPQWAVKGCQPPPCQPSPCQPPPCSSPRTPPYPWGSNLSDQADPAPQWAVKAFVLLVCPLLNHRPTTHTWLGGQSTLIVFHKRNQHTSFWVVMMTWLSTLLQTTRHPRNPSFHPGTQRQPVNMKAGTITHTNKQHENLIFNSSVFLDSWMISIVDCNDIIRSGSWGRALERV